MHIQIVVTLAFDIPCEMAHDSRISDTSIGYVEDDNSTRFVATGFVSTFGVNADGFARAVAFVEERMQSKSQERMLEGLPPGKIVNVEAMRIEPNQWPVEVKKEIKRQNGNINEIGIYYTSGRAFYGDDE